MTRDSLHDLARKILAGDLTASVSYVSFLAAASPCASTYLALDRIGHGKGTEADVSTAERELHLIIDLLPAEDVRTAGRFLEYMLDGEEERSTERLRPRLVQ